MVFWMDRSRQCSINELVKGVEAPGMTSLKTVFIKLKGFSECPFQRYIINLQLLDNFSSRISDKGSTSTLYN
jgi:hypothetical protein